MIDAIKTHFGGSDGQPLTMLAAIILVSLTLVVLSPPLFELIRYFQFTRNHDKFHRNAAERLRGKVVAYFSAPWCTRTYYLSDSESIKRMFMSNPALHAHKLAEILHEMVWEVQFKPDMAPVDKMVHQAMAKGKLIGILSAFEKYLTQLLQQHREMVGKEGKLMPVHHMGFRLIYNASVPAVMGPKYPLDETRINNQILADSMQGLNMASMLPILPRSLWRKIIPDARRGVAARDAVKDLIMQWEKDGGVALSSDVYQNIDKALSASGADPEDRARWINMVQFGFSGNTGESIGWILVFLLQSPKLLEQVLLEVDSLPEGALAEVPMRQLCPYLVSAIYETFRFTGSVFSGRMVLEKVQLRGIDKVFSKGSIIRAMTRTASFDTTVWGPDAEHYRGSRFAENEELYNQVLVFGGGVSACPGRHFVAQEMPMAIAHILRSFRFGPLTFCEKNGPTDPLDKIKPQVEGDPHILIDKDGNRLPIRFSGFDIDKGVEAISGLLVPKFEPVAWMTPREP